MARRVFFSFHFENDIWRVNQVRNANVVAGADQAGFFDHSEYAEAEKKSLTVIDRMIRERLAGTTVTIVLIGTQTAQRPWVQREIELSLAQKNGLLGIHIHHLKNRRGESSWFRGPAPTVPWSVPFPCYDWDKDVARLARQIESAGIRADRWRAGLPTSYLSALFG
jgi:antiphage defense system Thoeris ThsB-like protein